MVESRLPSEHLSLSARIATWGAHRLFSDASLGSVAARW